MKKGILTYCKVLNKKIVCAFLIFSLFYSCAIHRKFPFICFRKECVLSQLHFYDAKESFRRAKINSSVRKKKREMNRSKERARKDKSYPPDQKLIDKREKDSLDYSKGFAGLCDESKVIFSYSLINDSSSLTKNYKNDTITIRYLFDKKEPSPDEKNEMKALLEKIGQKYLFEIWIKGCHNRSVLSEYELYWLDTRIYKITKYLKKLEVPSNKIKTDN